MSLEDNVAKFKDWAINLGCPLEKVPKDEALRLLFRSPQQSLIFQELMSNVLPRSQVKHIKDNVLLSKIEKHNSSLITTSSSKIALPAPMQRYLKIFELKQKISQTKKRIDDQKTIHNELKSTIKVKNVQNIQEKESLKNIKLKAALLKSKHNSLQLSIKRENATKKKIQEVIPVKLKSTNPNDSSIEETKEVLHDCVAALNDFYKVFYGQAKPSTINEAANRLWKRFRKIIADTPNYLLWRTLSNFRNSQLMEFNGVVVDNVIKECSRSESTRARPVIEMAIRRAYSEHIALEMDIFRLSKEQEKLGTNLILHCDQLMTKLQATYKFYGTPVEMNVDDIIDEYIEAFVSATNTRSSVDYLRVEIDRLEATINSQSAQLENHFILQAGLKDAYNEMEVIVERMQEEMAGLFQLRNKINYTRDLLKHLVDTKGKGMRAPIGMSANTMTTMLEGGFNESSVLCSTKLEFENTFKGDSTLGLHCQLVKELRINTPAHGNEINVFLELPTNSLFQIFGKKAIDTPIVATLPDSITVLCLMPGLILTPAGTLQEITKMGAWVKEVQDMSKELKSDFNLVEIDKSSINRKLHRKIEETTKCLDVIEAIGTHTEQTLKTAQKYYNFIIQNPLRKYIPPSKLFNGRKYQEYENEFMMYYRMVKENIR